MGTVYNRVDLSWDSFGDSIYPRKRVLYTPTSTGHNPQVLIWDFRSLGRNHRNQHAYHYY